ncbi:hypothetical protein TgHK011_007000 [Trichoderma gracile]|nr:hypothetical protein TgHK011_007000 [Trichoderma gracile]
MDAKGRYQLVQDDFEGEPITSLKPQSAFVQWLRIGAAVDACLLVLSIIAFIYAHLVVKKLDGHELVVATNAYFNLETRWMKAALLNQHNPGGPSIFVEQPSASVDKAWQALYEGDRFFLIEEDEVRRMGKDPEYAVKAPEQWGMGSNKYLAINQGQHDIYCLDQLRKFAYADHYFENKTAKAELNALHCLHTILQTLRCKWSVNLYTAFWVEGFENAAVDFNVSRASGCKKEASGNILT